MITRREAVRLVSAAALLPLAKTNDPNSPERLALIEAFKKNSEGLQEKFEAFTHEGDWVMPYRLFRPKTKSKVPLVIYLHGSGGQGTDNEKQLQLGNIFGTRVWLLPENQKKFPCYVLAPQSDRGWVGDGVRMALDVVDKLRKTHPIDDRRIYITGQSMGGSGVWNALANRPRFFAAAVICCGGRSPDDGTGSPETPVWNFHGVADEGVPISLSRDRLAARRKVGGKFRATEYPGVGHNVWEWAYTDPELVEWLFAQRRG